MNIEIKDRQLMFSETILLSKIFKDIGIKKLVDEVTAGSMDGVLNNENLTDDQRMGALSISVITYIFTEMHLSESNIYKLVSSYLNIPFEKVPGMEIDNIVNTFKSMFTHGLPTVITTMLGGNEKINEFKKKMMQG